MYSIEPTKTFTKILKELSQNEQKAVIRKLVVCAEKCIFGVIDYMEAIILIVLAKEFSLGLT